MEIRYTSRFDAAPAESRLQGPTVEVIVPSIAGVPVRTLALATLIFLALAAAAYAVWARRRSRLVKSAPVSPYERLRAQLESARGLRMQGDEAGFLLALTEINEELDELEQVSEGNWPEVIEGVRYGGQVPPREELERMVDRRIEEIRPDPQAAALKELHLKA